MNNPREIAVVVPGATYEVNIFKVTNDGLQDAGKQLIQFCKGNIQDDTVLRQDGLFTETLIAVAKKYLEENNVGPLASREGSMAITKLDEALMWIQKRAEDRIARAVQGTYKS